MKRTLARLVLGAIVPGGRGRRRAGPGPPRTLPEASPKASISQTVGLTDITISYHRPAVNKRKVWGELVPYNEVWRAGANENTTITFSSPVTVGGKPLAAGTYGLHMLPGEKDWTIMSRARSRRRGAASATTPRRTSSASPSTRRRPRTSRSASSTASTIRPTASVDGRPALGEARGLLPDRRSTRRRSSSRASTSQLRGLPRFGWQGWNQAAHWALRNDGDLDQALEWSDQSIGLAETFANLRTKARDPREEGRHEDGRRSCATSALKIATENDINLYGYPLLGQKKIDEAIAIFRKNVKDHPASWNTYDSLGEALRGQGRQEGRARELHEGARRWRRTGAEEADQRRPGEAQGVETRRSDTA